MDLFESPVVEVLIGLTFIYVLFSTIVSGINEAVASIVKRRSKDLFAGIRQLLGDETAPDALIAEIEAHPLIRSLGRTRRGKWRRPSYIPARRFAAALVDSLRVDDGVIQIRSEAGGEEIALDTPLGRQLEQFLNASTAGLVGIADDVAYWFDDVMDRVGGWYKRTTWIWLAAIAVAVAVVLNLDTIRLAQTAWQDDAVRSALVAEATEAAETTDLTSDEVRTTIEDVEQFGFPLWWSADDDAPNRIPSGLGDWASKVAGILITAAALTLGAPFWFDLLGRLTRLRGAGKEPPATNE